MRILDRYVESLEWVIKDFKQGFGVGKTRDLTDVIGSSRVSESHSRI